MKPSIVLCVLLCCGLVSISCSSAGTKVKAVQISKIKKGSTTKAEIVALIGLPTSTSLRSDGKEALRWDYAHTTFKGATFIPVAGLFAGGTETKITTFEVILNSDKVVEEYVLNDSKMVSRMGN